jgi:hypothetical protein
VGATVAAAGRFDNALALDKESDRPRVPVATWCAWSGGAGLGRLRRFFAGGPTGMDDRSRAEAMLMLAPRLAGTCGAGRDGTGCMIGMETLSAPFVAFKLSTIFYIWEE